MEELINENEIDEKEEEREEIGHLEIINQIEEVRKKFDEIDDYFNNLSFLQSQNDEYIQDLLHYVENHDFTQATALKFVELLKEKRRTRRKLNNDFEIKKQFDMNRNKFALGNQRVMAMASLYKKEKDLNKQYKERVISFSELDELISSKKKKKSEEVVI